VNVSQTPLLPQHRRHQARESSGSRRLIGFLAFVILLGVAFAQPLISLAKYAAITDLHSHILLVPFISAYLICRRYKQLPKGYSSSWVWELLSLLLGLGSLFAAGNFVKVDPALSQNDFLSLTAFSFVCLIAMGGFLFLGQKWTTAAFPFAFLIFMVPLSDALVHWLETASKLASAEAAALLFGIVGMPVLRDGTVFSIAWNRHRSRSGMQRHPIKLGALYHQRARIVCLLEKPLETRRSGFSDDSAGNLAQWVSHFRDRSALRGIWPANDP
jgi:hypothetical protein